MHHFAILTIQQAMASHGSTPAYSVAPTYRLPSNSYALVEYPGPVASTSTSQSQAIKTLGGVSRLSKALHADNGVVEVNFRPDVTFSHAVSGENITDGCNIVLLKVIKKRRRRTDKTKIVGERVVDDKGVYKMEVMGVVEKLVRFRGASALLPSMMNVYAKSHVCISRRYGGLAVSTAKCGERRNCEARQGITDDGWYVCIFKCSDIMSDSP